MVKGIVGTIGFLLIFGAIGSQDYAIESGTAAPSLLETLLWCGVGIVMLGYGISGVVRKGSNQ